MPPAAEELDRWLLALAAGPRRALVALLRQGALSQATLAQRSALPSQQVAEHLLVLCDAGLVVQQQPAGSSKQAIYELHLPALQAIEGWFTNQHRVTERPLNDAPTSIPKDNEPPPAQDYIDVRTGFMHIWPDTPPAVYAIGQRLLRLGAHVNQALSEAAGKLDLLAAELLLLDALLECDQDHTLTPTQLRSHLHLTQGGITKCIARLEAMGLVQREPDPRDGRGVLVKMLPRARKLMANSDLWGTDAVAAFQMNPAERDQLADLLRELLWRADREALRRAKAKRGR